MNHRGFRRGLQILALVAGLGLAAAVAAAGSPGRDRLPALIGFPNRTGEARTLSVAGPLDLDNPFFQSLGSNGRSCVTCHVPSDGWSIVPAHVQARFRESGGQDPLFQPNDGSTSPLADISTVEARRAAYRLLLSRGLIRVGLGIPAGAEFTLVAVDDPHGYASAAELSLFRRPLPSTNLGFLTTVMWDGRETSATGTLYDDLARQADAATRGHAEATRSLTPAEQQAIVDLETATFTAQDWDRQAGRLRAARARGGVRELAEEPFVPELAGPFTLFDAWWAARGRWGPERQAVARGQAVFNTRSFGPSRSTCAACHSVPNVGSHAAGGFFNLGLSDEERRPPELPLYTLRCLTTGREIRTTDPGRALVTGRCSDIGRFKVPALRGLAARAPYFHNGSAATLGEVVEVYEQRFGIGLTAEERADLVAFLRAL
jgi:cytochrome c peroxidase